MNEDEFGTDRTSFSLDSDFQAADPSHGLELGPMELQYQELFAEALEDGVITPEERARLERAAENLGLNHSRLESLEDAMTTAYETHHRVRVVDQTLTAPRSLSPLVNAPPIDANAPPALAQPRSPQDDDVETLRGENETLRARINALESELLKAQAAVNVEVDLSTLDIEAAATEEPQDVWRRVRLDPSDADGYRALKDSYDAQGNVDGKYLAAQALTVLGAATPEETALAEKYRPDALIAPRASINEKVWRDCLFHPEEEVTPGNIFALVAPAILIGRVTTLRRDGLLHQPKPETKQELSSSTIMSVRAVGWAAALLGLPVPGVYTEPSVDDSYVHAAGMPPYTVLGKRALSGRTIGELAFLVGRHLSGYRGEHFVKTLFTATEDLEDLFLSALLIANPKLPLKGSKRARLEPLARAIEPLLDASQVDTLRGHYLRFADEGGRTNLQRWSSAVTKSGARVGLALSQDLHAATSLLQEEEGELGPLALDLLSYSTGARFLALRENLGISATAE